jgi:hypothetical protein
MKGCPFLVEDCTMDGTDYDCEHPTYGAKYGCDRCPMFGRNGGKRQYRLVNPRVTPPNTACSGRVVLSPPQALSNPKKLSARKASSKPSTRR